MKVAVYPGSFDPMHIGHLAILRKLCGDGGFGAVYLVISPQNPFKDPEKAKSAQRRYEAALQAAGRHPELKIKVEDIELKMTPPNYTIRTLRALQAREPGNEFTLVIGADNIGDFPRWRCARKLLSGYDILVYPRPGYDAHAELAKLKEWCKKGHIRCRMSILDAPLVDVSSTQLRQALAEGKDISNYLM
ncbi:MAG: nicotinate (nicotinamide) nucleotide adenylyltransferase [Bacteroidales bacterium]|nr:nicotinate (nicotinamide) nucleotide adenylyltransferase [Bacteroidales bacterium]